MKSFKIFIKTTMIIIICITIFSFLQTGNAVFPGEQSLFETQGIDDLGVSFVLNQSSIGRYSGAFGNLTLQNNLIDPITDLTVNFSLSSQYAKFSPTSTANQELSLLNPGASSSFLIETILNITKIDEANGIDVVLLFDSSGSMQDEIDSVRAEFLEVTSHLEEQIAALRMGMIVYGWGEYSEYPASSTNNYVELTDDISAVSDLLNEIYAGGSGVEPWGDAFAVINGWTWRENVPKLAIIIGDEDCDPGHIVGVGSTDFWYNGSQLLDVITSLKEKGVQINSVYTDDLGYVIDQFEWISSYTGGECVDLQELQSRPEPVELPDLIEGWTISLAREYFVDLKANISWTEPVAGEDYSKVISQEILIDLAPPSITVTTLINEVGENDYELEVFAKPRDVSGISQINMYYTYDDLNNPFEPTWHFRIMDTKVDDTYIEVLSNLVSGDLVSFYVEASDSLNNYGKTSIYNLTINPSALIYSSMAEFLLTEDNASRYLFFNFSHDYSFIAVEGYLWIDAEQELTIQIDTGTEFTANLVYGDARNKIYKLRRLTEKLFFRINIMGNTSTSSIKVKWCDNYTIENWEFEHRYLYLNEDLRCYLYTTTLRQYNNQGYFSLIPESGELVASVTIFDENWTKIVKVGMYEPVALDNGKYFLWVEHVIREGYCLFYFGPDQITSGDPYYRTYTAETSLPIFITIISINLILFVCFMKRKRKTPKG